MDLGSWARRFGVYDRLEPAYSRRLVRVWQREGQPIPAPSAVKREIIRRNAVDHGLRVLVETGTYKGDTVRALRHDFAMIHSIELDRDLFEAAERRTRRQRNVVLHLGDSAALLHGIAAVLQQPALFWLDAHFSGGVTGGEFGHPVTAELAAVVGRRAGHVVLIDDVREFGVAPGYPTLDNIRDFATAHDYAISVAHDVARLVPRGAVGPGCEVPAPGRTGFSSDAS